MQLRLAAPRPESSWEFEPFMFLVLTFEPHDYVINNCCLKYLDVCKLKYSLFILAAMLFCLPIFR
jgi:hypothetical protein